MIKNEKQYKTAKSQLNKLKTALDASINTTIEMPREIYEAMIAGIQSQIEEVELKIAEYEALSKTRMLTIESIKDIGQYLIKARVARGYTQKELAEIIGKKPQQIQKYEATEYISASLEKLYEIAKALGVESIDALVPLGVDGICADMKDWSISNIGTTIKNIKSKSKWANYTKHNEKALGNYNLKKVA